MTPRRLTPALAAAAAAAALVAGCGGDDGAGDAAATTAAAAAADAPPTAPSTPTPPVPAPQPAPETLPGLPPETAGFMGWDRLNRAPIPPDSRQAQRVGFDAHRGVKHVYVSVPRERLTPGGAYPDGTRVVGSIFCELDEAGRITRMTQVVTWDD